MPVAAETAGSTSDPPAQPAVIITELQAANLTAGDEFVELYNTTDDDIDLNGGEDGSSDTWRLQFFSSTKASATTFAWETTPPSSTIALTGTIAAHEFYLLASTKYLPGNTEPDQVFSPRMSDKAGAVRLVKVAPAASSVTEVDRLGWITADTLPVGFMAPHQNKGSWQRPISEDDSYFDGRNVLVPFEDTADTTPKTAWLSTADPAQPPTDPVDEVPPPEDTPDMPTDGAPDPATNDETDDPAQDPVDPATPSPDPAAEETPDQPEPLLSPVITELLPNPAAPQTDGQDEYVELFNPNDTVFDLIGYQLDTGVTNAYHVRLDGLTIPAFGYTKITSGESTLSLANSSGHARLVNTTGAVISQTDDYSDAPDGSAWALINSAWQWTTTPTPLAANVLSVPPIPAPKVTAAKKTTTKTTKVTTNKKPTTVKSKTTAVKGVSTKTSGKTSSTKTSSAGTATANNGSLEAASVPPIHRGVLAVAGGLALVYATYEYRQDIANRLYQFRRYRADRRAARSKLTRR